MSHNSNRILMVAVASVALLAPPLLAPPLLAPPLASAANDVTLQATASSQTASVAEPIELKLIVTAPVGTIVSFGPSRENLGAFEVHRFSLLPDVPLPGKNLRQWTASITVDTLESGDQTIPAIEVQYRNADETEIKVLRSEPIAIRIVSLLEDRADPTDFRDIKEVVDIDVPPVHSYAWMGWTAGVVGLIGVLAVVAITLTRRQSKITAGEWARQQIAQLKSLLGQNDLEPAVIYGELANVVREYIELQFGITAPTMASDELLAELSTEKALPEHASTKLKQFLSIADQVKFARLSLSEIQLRDALDNAQDFVDVCNRPAVNSTKEAG